MKKKFDSDNYKSNFIQNDVDIINQTKDKLTNSAYYMIFGYFVFNMFFLYSVCDFILFNIFMTLFSISLLFLIYKLFKKYIINKSFETLVKNYLVKTIFFILQITITSIVAILSFPNSESVKLIWLITIITTVIISIFAYLVIDNKYMKIENLNFATVSSFTCSLIGYLIAKKLGDQLGTIGIFLFICFILVLSGVSKNIIRSIRLLKYAPKDVLEHTE